MTKLFRFGSEALISLKSGIDKLAKAVASTLGPSGRNVIMKNRDTFGGPYSTKDGVTVAKDICLPDPFENIGASLVKEVALKTVEVAGDGTTTAIVLAQAMFSEAVKAIVSGMNPVGIKKGIQKAIAIVEGYLEAMTLKSLTDEHILQIATVATNNDVMMGRVVLEAMKQVGEKGRFCVRRSNNQDTWLDIMDGLFFESVFVSAYFINDKDHMYVEMDNPYVLLCNDHLTDAADLSIFLSKVQEAGMLPLIILCNTIEGEALSLVVVNATKGKLPIAAVQVAPVADTYLSVMEDMAAFTNATIIDSTMGMSLDMAGVEVLGRAGRIRISKDIGEIIDGHIDPDRVRERVSYLEKVLHNFEGNERDHDAFKHRLASFSGGCAFIYVGASTEMLAQEKMARMEDAAQAVKCAVKEGLLPGGGTALAKISYILGQRTKEVDEEERLGVDIVRKALVAPLKKIAENCGRDGTVIVQDISNDPRPYYGYNGLTDSYENLVDSGIVDSLMGVRTSLKKAASVVSILITGDVLIVEKPESVKKAADKTPFTSLGSLNSSYPEGEGPLEMPPGLGHEWKD
ncbi:chaperonin GroEL [Candidatus Clavichlamydia salmonicola]|uniref:chaperonin GroEL n=1 Tax=Candidatus Clavichlamydia salmonicola TaxID=469812 RepID=UPI001891CD76|nr:chaperonin GroEL [Candidatus Clavichlamydia salmonicola]